jgi:hypothetical protein
MLWAGSTFSLRAVATTREGRPLSVSNAATVTVGEVIRWRVAVEGEPALTVPGAEGWFTLLIQNRSNTVDALSLRLKTHESVDASPWSIALFEQQQDGSGFSNGLLLADVTSPLMPGESRRLFLRARPPGDRNTDGAWINWVRRFSQRAPTLSYSRDFACGVEASRGTHTSATHPDQPSYCRRARADPGAAPLADLGRVPTPPLPHAEPAQRHTPPSRATPASRRASSMPEPTHQTVLDWRPLVPAHAHRDKSCSSCSRRRRARSRRSPRSPLDLPSGVAPDPNLPLVNCVGNLCFADRQNRIWVYDSATGLFTELPAFSNQLITHLTALGGNLLAVGRADGQVDIYNGETPVVFGFRVPGAGSQPVRFVGLHHDLLILAVGSTLAIYDTQTAKWLWARTLDSAIVASPVLDTRTKGACYALTEGGWLYGFALPRGELLPLYPRRLFETWVTRAALACLTRADREVPYLYLQAKLADNTVRTLFITATNPLNRFVNPTTLMNTPIGSQWLFTGNTDQDLAIQWVSWGAGSDANRGAFYAFRLR